MKGFIKRLYDDFIRPAKYRDYEKIIQTAKESGYSFQTILSFESLNIEDEKEKSLIIRRDVDTKDIPCLRKFLEIEKRHGARSTTYFRWNTLDVDLMRDIAAAGGEVSYHFEEIATYCYKHRIRTKEGILLHIEDIRDLHIKQYLTFKKKTGQPCLTIAAHGDYVNSKLGVPNTLIIDERVRKATGIIREAYDKEHVSRLISRFADQSSDDFTNEVIEAIKRGDSVIEILTHPRQWNSPLWINLKEELNRVFKQLYMRL